jgi:phospholipid/cholesterol/gamma-HCH transport system substrate-binding protein
MKRSLDYARMNVRVGIMSLVAFCILVWVLFFPVRGVSPFASKIQVVGYYQRVDGLRKNAPVFYRGIEVGSVESVEIDPDKNDTPLKVIVNVEKRVVHLLPKDSSMEIVARGLLGDVFIDLVPGSSTLGPIADGDVLMTKPYESVLAGMNGIEEEIRSLLDRAQAPNTTIGRLFREDQLYLQLEHTIAELGKVAERVSEIERTVNEKLLDKSTKEGVDSAVASANRVLKHADELTAKADNLKWYLGVGFNKYENLLSSSSADVTIVPSNDKFYKGGIEFFKSPSAVGPTDYYTNLGGYLGYDAYLGLRILDSPVFFRGGLKRTSVDTGLDLRLQELVHVLPVEINADLSKYSQPEAELDLNASISFLKVFRITGGADDVLNVPRYRAGLSLIYDDEDLTSILIKSKM